MSNTTHFQMDQKFQFINKSNDKLTQIRPKLWNKTIITSVYLAGDSISYLTVSMSETRASYWTWPMYPRHLMLMSSDFPQTVDRSHRQHSLRVSAKSQNIWLMSMTHDLFERRWVHFCLTPPLQAIKPQRATESQLKITELKNILSGTCLKYKIHIWKNLNKTAGKEFHSAKERSQLKRISLPVIMLSFLWT